MNFYEFGINELINKGMFINQATEVMDRVVLDRNSNNESINKEMKGKWEDSIDNCPDFIKTVIFIGIEPFALEYIKEKCPEVWFRPLFDKQHPLNKEFEKLHNGVSNEQ